MNGENRRSCKVSGGKTPKGLEKTFYDANLPSTAPSTPAGFGSGEETESCEGHGLMLPERSTASNQTFIRTPQDPRPRITPRKEPSNLPAGNILLRPCLASSIWASTKRAVPRGDGSLAGFGWLSSSSSSCSKRVSRVSSDSMERSRYPFQ